jgi:hypothetical protein
MVYGKYGWGLVIVFGRVLDCGYMLFNLEFVRWAYSISQWGLFLYLGRIVFSGFSLGPWANFVGSGVRFIPVGVLFAVGCLFARWALGSFLLQWVLIFRLFSWGVFWSACPSVGVMASRRGHLSPLIDSLHGGRWAILGR